MQVKLTKKVMGLTVALGPDFISNGHFAIKRERVANAALFANEDTIKAAGFIDNVRDIIALADCEGDLKSLSPGGDVHAWHATEWFCEAGRTLARIFVSSKTGALAGLDRNYLALVDCDRAFATLYGVDAKSPFRDSETSDDVTYVVMPISIPAEGIAPKPAAEVEAN